MALGAEPTYTPSEGTNRAKKKLETAENAYTNKGAFSSPYSNTLAQTTDKIINRPKFSYDFNSDPVYLGLKDRYAMQGGMASVNAMSQAVANTGGFSNSYADMAGQQAYQQYLDKTFEAIPELAKQNYQRYQDEGNQLYNQANLLQQLERTDYDRYRDTVADLQNDLSYAQQEYQFMSQQDFDYYKNNLDKWLQDRDYYYQKELLDKKAAEVGYNQSSSSSGGKTNEQLAAEVWQGKWGNGQDRVNRLTQAGYDYWAVQALVDRGVGR